MQRVSAPRHCLNLFIPTKWNTVDGHYEGDLQSAFHSFSVDVAVSHNFARYDFWQTDVLGTFIFTCCRTSLSKLVSFLSVYLPATLHITDNRITQTQTHSTQW